MATKVIVAISQLNSSEVLLGMPLLYWQLFRLSFECIPQQYSSKEASLVQDLRPATDVHGLGPLQMMHLKTISAAGRLQNYGHAWITRHFSHLWQVKYHLHRSQPPSQSEISNISITIL